MQINKQRIADFARKISKNRDPNKNELGFWIFHPDVTLDVIKTFKECLPNVNLYYAIKCNPCPYLVQLMISHADGFDCASINEIKEALKLGANPKNISYSQTIKTIYELKEAYKLGVRLTLVDSIEEVEKISKIKDEIKDIEILIRYQSNDMSADRTLGGRLGLEEDEIDDVLECLKRNNLKMSGVHFHIGTGAHNPIAYKNGIRIAKETFEKAKKLGYEPYIIDIGGGYTQEESISKFAEIIEESLKKYGLEKMKIIAEPGRYIAAPSFSYVSNVLGKHKKKNKNLIYYAIDEGIHGVFSQCKALNILINCEPLNPKNTKKIHSIIGSHTCDSHDIVSDMEIEELEIGDWVIYYFIGAYSMSLSSNFNGFETTTRPIFHLPMKEDGSVVKIPEDVEKKGIPALWGLPGGWDL